MQFFLAFCSTNDRTRSADGYRELAETKWCAIVAPNNEDHFVNPVHIYCGCSHQVFAVLV
jgi:hypothetical protein